MNSKNYSNSKTTRFSTEIEGEGMELCLRGLLVACLLSALAICNVSIIGHRDLTPQPDTQTVVALVKPVIEPAAKL